LSAFAHDHNIAIRDFEGRVQFTPGAVSPGSLQLTIKAASLEVTDKVSADDRQKIEATMRKDVLDIDRHPLIVFNSTSIDANRVSEGVYQVKIWGDLTLHGTTKSGLIDAQVSFGADRLRAKGSFPLKQSDYGIKRVSVAGGTIKVKDDLRFTFDIVAHP
jgi:polyisoprenoid-binding protein YceI